MKKILLAILVVALAVSCFAMVATASAATTDVSTQSTLEDRGYIKSGSDYYNVDLIQDFEESDNTSGPFDVDNGIGPFYKNYTTINGSRALTVVVPTAQATGTDWWRGAPSFATWKDKYSKIYVQFDAYMTGTWANLYNNGGNYSSIQWNGTTWFKEGTVNDFDATQIAEKTYRISFVMDFATMTDLYNLQTRGDAEHVLAFDNLIIAGLDTVRAPWASSNTVTYDINNPADVEINLDTKGKAITGVTCGGDPVDTKNYSYSGEILTLKAAAFSGKTTDLNFTLITESGSADFTVTAIEGKITVTPTYEGSPVVKFEDGTTDVTSKITLTLTGISDGDVVDVTFDAAYTTAAAGVTKINISNITLTGKDAAKYTLSITSLQIDGEIKARTATTASYPTLIEKYYDGTTFFNLKDFNLTLSNIDAGDEVSVTYKAVFASKEAGPTKVNFTELALTGKDAQKYNLTNSSLSVDAYILEMKDIAISDGKGYFTLDGQTLQTINFDDVATGDLSLNSVAGLYLGDNALGQTTTLIAQGDNHILKVDAKCYTWTTQLFVTNETSKYRDAGIYAVSFKVKPENASMFEAIVRNADDEDKNYSAHILADFRLSFTNDASGKVIKVEKELEGWIAGNQKYFNESFELDSDGWISCYFEFEVPEGTTWDDNFKPNVTFLGASPIEGAESTYYFDDFKYICKSASNRYMTIDHNYDFEGENGTVVTDSIFYTDLEDGFVYDNTWIKNETLLRLDIPAGSSAEKPIGALRNSERDGDYKLFKGMGIHYVQFDFDMVDCTSFKIYSASDKQFNYFAITFTKSGDYCDVSLDCFDGWISNLTTQKLANGMTRISFVADMTGSSYDATYMNLEGITGSSIRGAAVFFDNFIVAHEDYTPTAKNTIYNLVGNDDVELNVDLKGARLTGLELDGVTVDEDLYIYDSDEDVILIDNTLFAGKTADIAIKVLTSAGDLNAKATLFDNRDEITLTLNYTGEPIAKDYDGTTDVAQAIRDAIAEQIVINGLNDGDEVSLTYDIAYVSKNAGSTTIQITNIALTGAQADNYKLGTTSLSVNATINKLQLTVSGTTFDGKVYDGTTTAPVTAGTLSGVLEGDNVTLTIASATLNSKNVSEANKVTVVYALQGDDADNYLAPVTQEITNITINKKAITVTAEAKTMTVGGAEPALTYTADGLVAGDVLSGELTREEGTEVGEYDILLGTLSNDNYQITFVHAKLTITEASTGSEPAKGLSTGAIVGIVVGCVAVAGAAALAVVFILKKKRLSK